MGDDLNEADFTDLRIADLRTAVREMMQQQALSNSMVARDAGIGESTFAAFMADKYVGRNAAQALLLQRWLTARHAAASVRMQGPRGPDFVRTKSSDAFSSLLEHAQFTPDFCVLVGIPGIGKTKTGQVYTRNGHNVWMVTAQPMAGSASQMVNAIGEELRITDQMVYGLSASLNRAVIRRLKGMQSLLIIDEAQHLTSQALDQLRTYHDLAGCGVVLMGNHSIFRQLEGGRGARTADYAQLFSRVGMRLDRKKPYADDIEVLLDAWEIADKEVRKVARAVARRPGALRAMTKVLRQAHMRARADDRAVTVADMTAAAAQLGDEKPLELGA